MSMTGNKTHFENLKLIKPKILTYKEFSSFKAFSTVWTAQVVFRTVEGYTITLSISFESLILIHTASCNNSIR